MTNIIEDTKWGEVDPYYPHQLKRWQNRQSENFIVIEETEGPHDEETPLRALLISENFKSEPEPIATIIESSNDLDEIMEEVTAYMKDHPHGSER